jgi:hypothetical protein
MNVPRPVWIAIATVSAIALVVGTVWWLRVRSVRGLAVLDTLSRPSLPAEAVQTSSASTTAFAAAVKASDEVVNRSVFFVPAPDAALSNHVVYPSEGALNAAASPPEPSRPPVPVVNQGSVDSDRDGLTDDQELQLGTDPRNPDTDGDQLSDGDEVKKYRTDPKKADTDGDGYSDAQEIKNEYNPLGTGRCLTTGCIF